MGWDFFFVYSHHFSPLSALSSHLAYTFSFPNRLVLIHLFYMKNHSQHFLPHCLVDAKKEG